MEPVSETGVNNLFNRADSSYMYLRFCQVDLWARGKIDEAAAQRKLIGV